MEPEERGLEGTWWYNNGRSYYKIFRVADRLSYFQQIGDGKELFGEFEAPDGPDADEWDFEAPLSNGARIRARAEGGRIVSSYQRSGSSEWRPPIVAERGAEPEQQEEGQEERRLHKNGGWYTKTEFLAMPGGPVLWMKATPAPKTLASSLVPLGEPSGKGKGKGKGVVARAGGGVPAKRGPAPGWVSAEALTSFVRCAVLTALTEPDDEEGVPLTSMTMARKALQDAIPRASAKAVSIFDRFGPSPIVRSMDQEALDQHQAERRAKAREPDPKTNIPAVPFARMGLGMSHPVSYNEEQMLRLFVGDPNNLAYNISQCVRSNVALDARLAERAHMIIIERHDVLRSAFRQEDPTNPMRTVNKHLPGGVSLLACANETDAHRLQAMDLGTAHQLGVCCTRASAMLSNGGCGSMGINIHHIATDADGLGLYWNELMQVQFLLYAGFSEEAVMNALPKLPVQFTDFAYWQKSLESRGLLATDLAYWYDQVVSSTPPLILDVPIDKPRPRVWNAVGATERILYENDLLLAVSEKNQRATPFAVTMANWAIVLSRLSGDNYVNIAVPFALRNMSSLMNLIGNFLNMMPVRVRHDPTETYNTMLTRVATSAVDVQRYSLGAFVQLVNETLKHYPVTDPSRNPVYASMVDLVPNTSEEPNTGLSGVLDVFLFVNTREGAIWSLDAVYNTTILEAQTVRMMLMQMPAILRQAARATNEPVPRVLPYHSEEAQPAESASLDLASMLITVGRLPRIVSVQSGWEVPGAPEEYYGIRNAQKLKRHSGLELSADYPPAALASLRPPGPPAPPPKPKAERPRALAAKPGAPARATKAISPQAKAVDRRAEAERRKARSYEIAARWAETQRVSELIPLDAVSWAPQQLQPEEFPAEDDDFLLLQNGRENRRRTAAGRGRSG